MPGERPERTIHVLRQYPASRHDTPLSYLAENGPWRIERYEYEAAPNPTGVPRNLEFLLSKLLVEEDDLVVLGAEPYDRKAVLFRRLARRHDVVFHTSWAWWDGRFVPQPAYPKRARDWWRELLGMIDAVGVTRASTLAVRELGARGSYVPHGVDTTTFRPDRSKGDGNPTVLFVGRLEKRKGVLELERVIRNWSGPPVEFSLVGDGPLADRVRTLAADYPVTFHGYVEDDDRLAEIYASSDAFVLPSYRVDDWEELFGIVVIEAMASGLPVVATDCIGPREIVDENGTGFVVPQRDTDALAEALASLVADETLRERLGEEARAVAEAHYALPRVARAWERVLERAVGSRDRTI